jgi:hypothetical protein
VKEVKEAKEAKGRFEGKVWWEAKKVGKREDWGQMYERKVEKKGRCRHATHKQCAGNKRRSDRCGGGGEEETLAIAHPLTTSGHQVIGHSSLAKR